MLQITDPTKFVPRVDLAATPEFMLGGTAVRPARRQLCPAAGDCRDVEPRVMQVLVALAEAKGDVVSRDLLIDRCWEGRIVGDDAVNRVIVQLRRLAREIEPQPFEIETVARVGYALLERSGERHAAIASTGALRRLRARWIGAGVALAALALATFLLSPRRPVPQPPPRVELGAMIALSRSVPSTLSAAFREEIIATFEVEDVVKLVPDGQRRADAPELVLSGTVQHAGGALRFTMHLRNRRSGASIWSQAYERSASFPLASRQIAIKLGHLMRCGLREASSSRRKLSDEQLSSWMQFCAMTSSDPPPSPGAMLDAARRMTQAMPDFAGGWEAVATYAVPFNYPDADRDELIVESEAAAARALEIDPQSNKAWLARAGLLAHLGPSRRMENLFRRAIESNPTDAGSEHKFYGDFLIGVGRGEDAAKQYGRARDMQPLALFISQARALALSATGRDRESRALFGELMELWPQDQGLRSSALRAAFWNQRYDDALALLSGSASMPEATIEALSSALMAMRSGDRPARVRAIEALSSLAKDPRANTVLVTTALASLGADEAALASLIANRGWTAAVPFDPSFVRVRHMPAFAALVEKLGFMRYWREARIKPDFCKADDAPPLCRSL